MFNQFPFLLFLSLSACFLLFISLEMMCLEKTEEMHIRYTVVKISTKELSSNFQCVHENIEKIMGCHFHACVAVKVDFLQGLNSCLINPNS